MELIMNSFLSSGIERIVQLKYIMVFANLGSKWGSLSVHGFLLGPGPEVSEAGSSLPVLK